MNHPIKPTSPSVLRLSVLRKTQISPNMVRLTFGGADLGRFTPSGADQWFRMFFLREGQRELWLPSAASHLWYAQYLATSQKNRAWVRNYTVRAFRNGEAPEMDVDMVSHDATTDGGESGPASRWAARVQPGDPVGVLDQGRYYNPPADATEQLLVSDESGLPAIMGILESGEKLPTRAFVEVPDAADAQPLPKDSSHVEITWLPRKDPHSRPGKAALEALKSASRPDSSCYAFAVGEQALATSARRYLVNETGLPKSRVTFVGYWRLGQKGHG
jgi:NADPH-dependent ferric siderophore reductase